MSDHKLNLALVLLFWCSVFVADGTPNRCKPKYVTHRATQVDINGRICEDDVRIKSCGGFCLTSEIPDWQFPYKQSRHHVCQHDKMKHRKVLLKNCDPNVEPSTRHYHYVEPASCKCKICSSENTSCEWLPPGSSFIRSIDVEESDESNEVLDENY